MSDRMTDEQVRAVLERIDKNYLTLWAMLNGSEDVGVGGNECVQVDALRLLAKFQQALGEIATSEASMYYSKATAQPCRICMHLIKIARTHLKGGK